MNALTDAQKTRLDEMVGRVNFCLGEITVNGQEAAKVACKIRDEGLWKTITNTWPKFCEINGWTRQRLSQIADFGSVLLSLPENLATMVATERSARELSKAPPEARSAVVESLLERGEKVTAKTIKNEVLSLDTKPKIEPQKPPQKPPIELDEVGTPIPKDALPFWHRREEVQGLLTAVSRIKCAVEKAKNSEDPLFGNVSNGLIADLTKAYTHLQEAKPYAVCTVCQGSFSVQPRGCSTCCNTGLVSKWHWEMKSPKEIKDIRIRANAARA